MNAFYGFCMDGHLHQIKTQYLDIAQKNKAHFETTMFKNDEIDEQAILDKSFIPLPPTNCPNIANLLPFGRLIRKNTLPSKPILPFCADLVNERTPVAFLLSFEEHTDRINETKEQGKYKLYSLIKEALSSVKPDHVEQLSYETLREKFLRKFWNIKIQKEVHAEFIDSKYPAYRGQKVRDYVYYWLHRFTFNTVYLTRTIVQEMSEKIPQQYEPGLQRFFNGAKWYDVYEAVVQLEDSSSVYVDYEERQCQLFGGCNTTFVFSAVISLLVMILGIASYFIYYELGLDQ